MSNLTIDQKIELANRLKHAINSINVEPTIVETNDQLHREPRQLDLKAYPHLKSIIEFREELKDELALLKSRLKSELEALFR